AKGNTALVSGTILPIDVWSTNGVKYFVEFNDLCQPIRKGGHVLIRFIGMMAKMETHCPVGEEDWHAIDSHIKGKIVTDIRDRFVIPDGAEYDKQALKRANKAWRQYRFSLKKEYYKPKEKTLDEMCSQVPPSGISSNNWIKLVKYWHSDKGKDDVNAKVEQLRLKYPTKSQLELENEAFEEIMYQDEIPDRPVGYGLGVKKGDIYGVRGVLRKEGYGKIQRNIVLDSFKEEMVALHKKNDKLEKEKEKLKDQVQQNNFLFKTLIGQFS
ncbi:50S ribosomal protein L9 chloroplastic, partial [Bienertia sinuspersici]